MRSCLSFLLMLSFAPCGFAQNQIGKMMDTTTGLRHVDVNTSNRLSKINKAIFDSCVFWHTYSASFGTNYFSAGPVQNHAIARTAGEQPTWSSSGGGSLSFDGVTDMTKMPHANSLTNFSDSTWAFWYYPRATNVEQSIARKLNSMGGGTPEWTFVMRGSGSYGGRVNFIMYRRADGLGSSNTCTSLQLETNKWTFLAVTFDRAQAIAQGSAFQMWTNGLPAVVYTSVPSYILSANNQSTNDIFFGFGPTTGSTSGYLTGSLGDFWQFNRKLTALEVTNLYNATCEVYGKTRL